MFTLALNKGQTPGYLNQLAELGKRPRPVLAAGGRAVANHLKRHYRQKYAQPVGHFGRRTGFWLSVMRGVQNPVIAADGLSGSVTVSHPAILQKLLGGTITAKRVRFLTIPLSDEAYGRTARTFEHETGQKLFPVRMRNTLLLASKNPSGRGLIIHYLLKRSVTQRPDPTALPPTAELESAFAEAARKAFIRELQRN